MLRPTLLSLLLLTASLAGVGAGVLALIARDRAALVASFAADRTAGLETASSAFAEDLEDVGDDLRLAAELLARPGLPVEHERELTALLEVVRQYKAIAVFGPDGESRQLILERRAQPRVREGAYTEALQQTALQALSLPPGAIATSPPLAGEGAAWLRVFATAVPAPGGGAVAVLVDLAPFVAPFGLLTAQPEVRLLLLGAHGRPTPASDPALAAWVGRLPAESGRVPHLAGLLTRMQQGERGTLSVPEAEAELLGLGAAEALATFTPIEVKGGSHWSVAALASTTPLRVHEHSIVLRLGLAGAAGALLLVAFAVHLVVANRRAVALRESRRHADRLAHLHEKTQAILDHIPTGVLALSASGVVTALNQPLRARLPPEALGSPLSQALPQAERGVVEALHALVEEACRSGRVLPLAGGPVALFGEAGPSRVHAVPLPPREPEVRALLVVEDLSAVRALELQLLRAEKLATVGVLAAGIAHEIGTPLGIVRGRAEYVLGKLEEGHPQRGSMGVIIEQIDLVSRTLRQLLDFSRLQPAVVQPVSLGGVVTGMRELLRLEAARRHLTLAFEVPPSLPPLAADADALQQVLVNLALNACDACREGGVVRLSAAVAEPGRVRVVVEDDGCGIPPERLHQVFDPFFTTKKRGQGTGLGLTLVAQVVRNHGGSVELESAPGKGTRVTLHWPQAEAATRQHAERA